MKNIKLGYREKEILCGLYKHNEMWINDIYRFFSPGKGSYKFVAKRIGNLNKKGLISVYTKYNPET
ncbi:MAG: hypothetical protein OWS74_03065, partial [Firmicutes bacterium]|nr:hypothetical protein [Bacillota bacterium]